MKYFNFRFQNFHLTLVQVNTCAACSTWCGKMNVFFTFLLRFYLKQWEPWKKALCFFSLFWLVDLDWLSLKTSFFFKLFFAHFAIISSYYYSAVIQSALLLRNFKKAFSSIIVINNMCISFMWWFKCPPQLLTHPVLTTARCVSVAAHEGGI